MTAIIPFDPNKLAMSLRQVAREAAPMAAFLKMDKTGAWVYGANTEEVEDGTEFLVNPNGFQHGYVCWAAEGSEKLGEVIAPVSDALGDTGPVPGGGRAWEFQLGMHLKGMKGELADMELVFRSSSVGGKRAIAGLAQQVAQKLADGEQNMVPVVTLSSESYKHKKYGKIYTPVIDIVRWTTMPKASPAKAAPEKAAKAKRK